MDTCLCDFSPTYAVLVCQEFPETQVTLSGYKWNSKCAEHGTHLLVNLHHIYSLLIKIEKLE
jgi:hypothetical protein